MQDADDAGQVALALVRVRRLLADAPTHWPARAFLARTLATLRRPVEARAVLDHLIADSPRPSPDARYVLDMADGELSARAGDVERALRAYQRVRDQLPECADAYVFAGALLAVHGRLAEAEAMHRAGTGCLTGAPDESWYNLGLVLRAQERYAEAAAAFVRAIEIDPAYEVARAALADVRAAMADESPTPPS